MSGFVPRSELGLYDGCHKSFLWEGRLPGPPIVYQAEKWARVEPRPPIRKLLLATTNGHESTRIRTGDSCAESEQASVHQTVSQLEAA